jgi:hypothetical protein
MIMKKHLAFVVMLSMFTSVAAKADALDDELRATAAAIVLQKCSNLVHDGYAVAEASTQKFSKSPVPAMRTRKFYIFDSEAAHKAIAKLRADVLAKGFDGEKKTKYLSEKIPGELTRLKLTSFYDQCGPKMTPIVVEWMTCYQQAKGPVAQKACADRLNSESSKLVTLVLPKAFSEP